MEQSDAYIQQGNMKKANKQEKTIFKFKRNLDTSTQVTLEILTYQKQLVVIYIDVMVVQNNKNLVFYIFTLVNAKDINYFGSVRFNGS